MLKKKLHILLPLSSVLLKNGTNRVSGAPFSVYTPHYSSYCALETRDLHLSGVCQILRRLLREEPNLGLCATEAKKFCSSASSGSLRCWSCNTVPASDSEPFLFCNACRSVQPVDQSIDYFRIFGLDRGYDIEEENLEGKYKDWQKKLHPDLAHSKSEKEKGYAAEQSARVIDAYRTLTNPLSRAIYCLKLEGVHVDEEERVSDLELLAEIMEIREAVEEAADIQVLRKIESQILEKLELWTKTFGNFYRSKNYEEAVASIRRMTYYKRAHEEITKKL